MLKSTLPKFVPCYWCQRKNVDVAGFKVGESWHYYCKKCHEQHKFICECKSCVARMDGLNWDKHHYFDPEAELQEDEKGIFNEQDI